MNVIIKKAIRLKEYITEPETANFRNRIEIENVDFIDLDLILKLCRKHKLILTIRFDEE